MDAGDVTALIAAGVAAGTASGGVLVALLTVRQKREVMSAEAGSATAQGQSKIMDSVGVLLEQSGTMVPKLLERITLLEASNERIIASHERILDEQAAERHELTAWRQWGALQVSWAAQAVDAIRRLGGTIADPPAPPTVDRRSPAPSAGGTP